VHYKVAPPSERNQLKLSLLSSSAKSETGTNSSKDFGRPLIDFRAVFTFGREIIRKKNRQLTFFFW